MEAGEEAGEEAVVKENTRRDDGSCGRKRRRGNIITKNLASSHTQFRMKYSETQTHTSRHESQPHTEIFLVFSYEFTI